MPVVVRVPIQFRELAEGAREVTLEAQTIAGLIDELERHYPGVKSKLCQENGEPHRFINLYINGEDIRFRGGLAASLSDGDSVAIVPAVAGG